jgi:hypothetical protein
VPVDGFTGAGFAPENLVAEDLAAGDLPAGDLPAGDLPAGDLPAGDLPAEDLPPADLPGESFALFDGIFAADDLAADCPPEGLAPEALSPGDLAGRGFMNIGTSAARCLRKRAVCFAADVLRDRERAIKPHTHRACPDDFCSRRHLSRAFPLAEHQTKYVLKWGSPANGAEPKFRPRGQRGIIAEAPPCA